MGRWKNVVIHMIWCWKKTPYHIISEQKSTPIPGAHPYTDTYRKLPPATPPPHLPPPPPSAPRPHYPRELSSRIFLVHWLLWAHCSSKVGVARGEEYVTTRCQVHWWVSMWQLTRSFPWSRCVCVVSYTKNQFSVLIGKIYLFVF